jgi:hypothetical protein
MAETTGIVLAVGGITVANEVIFAPLVRNSGAKPDWNSTVNWRVVPATLGLALALGLLEKAAPGFAKALAWMSLLVVLVVPLGNAPTPLQNIQKVMGYPM